MLRLAVALGRDLGRVATISQVVAAQISHVFDLRGSQSCGLFHVQRLDRPGIWGKSDALVTADAQM